MTARPGVSHDPNHSPSLCWAAAAGDRAGFWLAGRQRYVCACGNSHCYGRERRPWRLSQPGGAGRPATATATSSDQSNSATAIGGNGGVGGPGGAASIICPGPVQAATAARPVRRRLRRTRRVQPQRRRPPRGERRTWGTTPLVHSRIQGAGAGGGAASAISSATGGGAGTVVSDATATGGAAPWGYNNPAAGTASASASASSTGSGLVEANASAFDPSRFTSEYYLETGDRASVTASPRTTAAMSNNGLCSSGQHGERIVQRRRVHRRHGIRPRITRHDLAGPRCLRCRPDAGRRPDLSASARCLSGMAEPVRSIRRHAVFDFTTFAKEEALD